MPRSSYLVTPTKTPYTQSVQITSRPAWIVMLVLAIVGGVVLLAGGCTFACVTGAVGHRYFRGGAAPAAVTAPTATTTAAPAAVVSTPSASASPVASIGSVPSRIDVYHHGMTSPQQSVAPSPDSPEERWRQYQARRLRERDER